MGRTLNLLLIGCISLLSIVSLNTSAGINSTKEKAVEYFTENYSQNICNSMAGILMSALI